MPVLPTHPVSNPFAVNKTVHSRHLHTVEVAGSNPAAPTNIFNDLGVPWWISRCSRPLHKSRKALNKLAIIDCGSPLNNRREPLNFIREKGLNQTFLGLSLCRNLRLRVNLKREPAAGVAHQLLNHLDVLSICDQES